MQVIATWHTKISPKNRFVDNSGNYQWNLVRIQKKSFQENTCEGSNIAKIEVLEL